MTLLVVDEYGEGMFKVLSKYIFLFKSILPIIGNLAAWLISDREDTVTVEYFYITIVLGSLHCEAIAAQQTKLFVDYYSRVKL